MKDLWEHQDQCLEAIDQAIEEGHKSIAVCGPTGCGKSTIMFEMMKRRQEKMVLHTNRTGLFTQLHENMQTEGIPHGLLASGYEPTGADKQLAMLQSLESWCVRGNRGVHPAAITIWDECHNLVGGQSIELRSKYGDCVDVGFTATPIDIGHVYTKLIVAAETAKLRKQGILAPIWHYGAPEVHDKILGTIKEDGECGIVQAKRDEFAYQIFGDVFEHYKKINPEKKPTLMFAPGVKQSIWLCEQLNHKGLRCAHVDAARIWFDGEVYERDRDALNTLKRQLLHGDIDIVSNCQVLREGIDWPFVEHIVFATIFGSLKAYIQSGGRGMRAYEGKKVCTLQDHGGNWWRHGSLNATREWELELSMRQISGERIERIRNKEEHPPTICPACELIGTMRNGMCTCGFRFKAAKRIVRQLDGSLREMQHYIFRKRTTAPISMKSKWIGYARSQLKSQRFCDDSFAQIQARWAQNNPHPKTKRWQFPDPSWPMVPVHYREYYTPFSSVRDFHK